ncbi:MAG: alkaline phosphatase family protein, partial [Gammaproteobacteria bacterium]
MSTTSRVIIIGIDSADKGLILQWAREGVLPTFAAFLRESAWGLSENPPGLVAGTVWPTFYTGVLPGRTGRFRGTTQFIAGTYKHGDIKAANQVSYPPFWEVLSAAGKRGVVIDAPYSFLSDKINGVQLLDWTSHSPWKDGVFASSPPELASEVEARFGRDAIGKCDFAELDNAADFRSFRDSLINRVNQKKELSVEFLKKYPSDVFFTVFSESHCVGHQCWHLHDSTHPLYDARLVDAVGGDPVRQVYKALDGAIAEVLEQLGPSDTVLVHCSHGMGPAYTGTHLLDEILLRLDGIKAPKKRQLLAQRLVHLWTLLPQRLRTLFTPLQKRVWPTLKNTLVQPNKAWRSYFEVIINDASGGIRLNVVGREPKGRIKPGAEYDAVCEELE